MTGMTFLKRLAWQKIRPHMPLLKTWKTTKALRALRDTKNNDSCPIQYV